MSKVVFLLVLPVCFFAIYGVVGREYRARYQPELDWVTVDPYIKNERLFNLQVKCVLYDGPCDVVGRWVKPRVQSVLQGSCLLCTPNQHEQVKRLLTYMQEKRPELFKLAVQKFVYDAGLTLSDNHTFELKEGPDESLRPSTVTYQDH